MLALQAFVPKCATPAKTKGRTKALPSLGFRPRWVFTFAGFSPSANILVPCRYLASGYRLGDGCGPICLLCKHLFRSVLPLPKQKDAFLRPFVLAGVAGFGPTNAGVKVLCLTAWLYPFEINIRIITQISGNVKSKSRKSTKFCFSTCF